MKTLITLLAFAPTLAFAGANVEVSNAKIFVPRQGSTVTAGYATFTNKGKAAVKITIEKLEAFKTAELHETFEKDGQTGMRRLEALAVPAGGSAELKPGGNHMMAFDATRPLKAGEKLKAEFKADGKVLPVTFTLENRETAPAADHGAHHH
jgi:copper(I)-binding protein